jgi:hypothetical protein
MWNLLGPNDENCSRFRDSLEEGLSAESLPLELRKHAGTCKDCQSAAEDLAQSRVLLKALATEVEAKPWFAPRVMAAIAAKEAELRRSLDAWTVLPRLASRFAWVSVAALLLTGTWLYEKPATTSNKTVITDLTGEPVVDSSTPVNNDDMLVSLTEHAR